MASIFEHLWDVAVRRVLDRPRPEAVRLLGEDGGDFAPRVRCANAQLRDYVVTSLTVSGAPRTYRLFHEFLFPDAGQPPAMGREELLQLLGRLDTY